MANELYSVMVNSGGGLEFPLKQTFLENNNLVTKDEVSELVGDSGLVAHPKDTGYANYPNKVGSKGWYISQVDLSPDGQYALLYLSDTIPATLRGIKIESSEKFKMVKPSAGTEFTEIMINVPAFESDKIAESVKKLSEQDRLTIICQKCDFGSYKGSGQFQAILRCYGLGYITDTAMGALCVCLDTSEPYCDTVFNRGDAGAPTLEKIFYAWLTKDEETGTDRLNEIFGDSEDAIATRTLIPDENTVRVYGKPELGAVDLITSAVVEGIGNEASGQGSVSFGRRNKATGTGSAAFGRNHLVAGYASTALGQNNKVYGEKNLAFGMDNTTYGLYSTAIGKLNTVGDKDSGDKESNTAIGSQNTINGICSAGVGFKNSVSGQHSVALGELNTITNDRSFAAGRENTINTIPENNSADNHIALGFKNTISGSNVAQSVAIGSENVASHIKVYEFGTGLQSSDRDQVILGRYNATLPTDTEFAIGVGTSNTDRKTLAYADSNYLYVNGSKVLTENDAINKLSVGDKNTNEKNYTLTVGNNNVNASENGVVFGKQNNNKNTRHYASTNLLGEYLKQSPIRSSTVVGTYNDNTEPYLFSVGAGTAEDKRKNCFGVKGSKLYTNVDTANINIKNDVKIAAPDGIKLFDNWSNAATTDPYDYDMEKHAHIKYDSKRGLRIDSLTHNPGGNGGIIDINAGDIDYTTGGFGIINLNAWNCMEGEAEVNIKAWSLGTYPVPYNHTVNIIAGTENSSDIQHGIINIETYNGNGVVNCINSINLTDSGLNLYSQAEAGIVLQTEYTGIRLSGDANNAYIRINSDNFQVPIFNEDGSRTEDYATIKVVRDSNGVLQLKLTQ